MAESDVERLERHKKVHYGGGHTTPEPETCMGCFLFEQIETAQRNINEDLIAQLAEKDKEIEQIKNDYEHRAWPKTVRRLEAQLTAERARGGEMKDFFGTFDFFCNNCGAKNTVRGDWMGAWGRETKTCSQACHDELYKRIASAVLNKATEVK